MLGKIIFLAAVFLVVGCQSSFNNDVLPAGKAVIEAAKPVQSVSDIPVPRDRTIDESNGYNDIFLDSLDVERFIVKKKLNDTVAMAMRAFYNLRNDEYAWFSSAGLIEQSVSFRSLYSSENDADEFNKSLEARLDGLRTGSAASVRAKDPAIIETELQITERFIQYAKKNYTDMGIALTALGTYIPAKRRGITDFAGFVLASNSINDHYAALNESYRLLKIPLQQYSAIERSGGWPMIPATRKEYRVGIGDPAVALLKRRLQMTGELAGGDTSRLFDTGLENAVKTYQAAHGFDTSGVVTKALLKDMNIPVLARMEQLIVNMQRMRWMPAHPDGLLIIVNIPEFEVYVDSNKSILFQMDAVVGAEGHNTTMFSGNVSQVVFSPYWNIPPSIVRKEVVPGMRRERHYLGKRHMEITGREGGLPVVRQRPGADNALGKVKFLFPNDFNIYMHDTPEKGFFSKSERDLSHGCIRLSNALEMAYFLLRNYPAWPKGKIDSAMNSEHQQFVKLTSTVPVIITYYTAWVDNKGVLRFAGDIYGRDRQMAEKMFMDPQ
jgi:lipoprotein-anchoring transpeptidase ErfK/SrfK/uncharacterized protein YcfL